MTTISEPTVSEIRLYYPLCPTCTHTFETEINHKFPFFNNHHTAGTVHAPPYRVSLFIPDPPSSCYHQHSPAAFLRINSCIGAGSSWGSLYKSHTSVKHNLTRDMSTARPIIIYTNIGSMCVGCKIHSFRLGGWSRSRYAINVWTLGTTNCCFNAPVTSLLFLNTSFIDTQMPSQ